MANQHSDQLINELANEYSNYFKLDTTPQVKLIEECIEENLAHLEEFCTMIDLIRNENNGYLIDLVPHFKKKRHQLRIVYDKIDKMLELVDTVKDTVDSMENEMNKAETRFNSSNKLSKIFSSIIGSPKSDQSTPNDTEFICPTIFNTNHFFNPTDPIDSSELNKSV